MQFIFGVPTHKREARQEKYPDLPVLTMLPTPDVSGGNCKFELNPKLVELLGLELNGEEFVSISVQPEGEGIYTARLAVTTGRDVSQYKVRKNMSFSDKRMHYYMLDKLNLDGSVSNEFQVSFETETDGIRIYQLTLI